MKYIYFTLAIVAVLALNSSASGQVSSGAVASATIVQPINLSRVRDLNFGIVSPGGTSGTVMIDPTASSTRTASSGITLPSGSSTVQSAKFIVSGKDGSSFIITLPTTVTITDGSHFMTIDNFTSNPSGSGVLTSGSQVIYVGATLNLNANQAPGVYQSTEDFEVTINYN